MSMSRVWSATIFAAVFTCLLCAGLLTSCSVAASSGEQEPQTPSASSRGESVEQQQTPRVDATEVKASVDDYTWAELSQISAEIAAAGDEAAAIEVAKRYNLVGSNGQLDGTQTKLVDWEGSQVAVHIIGFAHDDKTDGGKAGITFQFVDCIAEHEMNPKSTDKAAYHAAAVSYGEDETRLLNDYPEGISTNLGGWEASSMREWLNSDLAGRLPEDLTSVIVAVNKPTNNTGWTNGKSAGVVTSTSDRLWLASFIEVCGGFTGELDELHSESRYIVEVENAEGREYKMFCDMGASHDAESPILSKCYNGSPCYWWARSPEAAYSDHFYSVGPDGHPHYVTGSKNPLGVAPCFCI